jgi:hypothetical protein
MVELTPLREGEGPSQLNEAARVSRDQGWPDPGFPLPPLPFIPAPVVRGKMWLRVNNLGLYFTAGPHHTAYCVSKAGMNAVPRAPRRPACSVLEMMA